LTQQHQAAAYIVQVSFAICVILHRKQNTIPAGP
jgi:hypothetical protein